MLVLCEEQGEADVHFGGFFLPDADWRADCWPVEHLAVYRLFSSESILDDTFSAADVSV